MTLADLHKPFPAAEIEWRVGSTNGDKTSGLALAYLTARHVMDRLDAVCGSENWQDRYEFHGPRTVCYLSIRVGNEWVTKADGAGDSDVEAEKGAISDALKRAAVKWGIGRYLYDLGNIWVDVEPAGRSVRIKRDQYKKLQDALNKQFGAGLSTAEPIATSPPPEPTEGLDTHLEAIQSATTLEALQDVFGKAWKQFPGPNSREHIKARYDERKKALTPPPRTLGDHLDNLHQQERASVQ
jgi:hypothetical protein